MSSPISRNFSDFLTMLGCCTLRTKVFQALNPIEPRQTWMLRALTCLISVKPRELSAYLRMKCNYFTCIVELVLPPLKRSHRKHLYYLPHGTCTSSTSSGYTSHKFKSNNQLNCCSFPLRAMHCLLRLTPQCNAFC